MQLAKKEFQVDGQIGINSPAMICLETLGVLGCPRKLVNGQ